MSQPDSHSPEDQYDGNAPRAAREEAPDLLSRIMHVASGLAQHIRENQSLRAEIIQILRHFEQAITPPEFPKSDPAPVEVTQEDDRSEGVMDQVAVTAPEQESAQATSPEAPLATIDTSVLRDLETGLASVNAFGMKVTTINVRPPAGLDAIARTCRMKAEACGWVVERKRLIAEGVDLRAEITPRERALIERAHALENCFLWMTARMAPMPEPLELYSELADRYEDAACIADLLAELVQQNGEREMLEAAMLLGAEAQSALREVVAAVGFRGDESSQLDLFHWLLQTAQERELYIPRFMRMADKPDESEIASLSGRIEELQKLHRTHNAAKKLTANALKTIRNHLNRISPERDNAYDWKIVFATVSKLVPEYLQANDVQLRELLVKYVDDVPEETEVSQAGQDVLEAIDLFLANRPEANPIEQNQVELTPEMIVIRKKLKGKTMVVIGGESRLYSKEALQKAFDLNDVVWISTREHESPETFRPYIRAPGVALVLLAIRWSSHSYGVVRYYCEDADVPFVRLPSGYNPSQVAHQIIEQVTEIAEAAPSSS